MYHSMLRSTTFSLKTKYEFGLNQCQIVAAIDIPANSYVPDLIGYYKHIKSKEMQHYFDNHYSIFSWDSIPYLLLGPVSFLNHSCVPNSIYVKDYKRRIMRVQTIMDIKAGEELTVSYGEKCRKCLPGEEVDSDQTNNDIPDNVANFLPISIVAQDNIQADFRRNFDNMIFRKDNYMEYVPEYFQIDRKIHNKWISNMNR